MGGFFMMLFKLCLLRLGPFVCLGFCKKINEVKGVVLAILCGAVLLFITAVYNLFMKEGWESIFYLLSSMFPHDLFYEPHDFGKSGSHNLTSIIR